MKNATVAAASLPETLTPTVIIGLSLLVLVVTLLVRPANGKSPPMLGELIPYFSNTYQFAADTQGFLDRAKKLLIGSKSSIVGYHLAGRNAYLVTGAANIQNFFRSTPSIDFERFFIYVLINVMGATPKDVAKFANDKTGRLATPLPGSETPPQGQRYWASLHAIMHKYLSQKRYTDGLATIYERFFSAEMDGHFPLGEPIEVAISSMIKRRMVKVAMLSFQGKRIFEVEPHIVDAMWGYDEVIPRLLFGPPRWLFRKTYATADRFCNAVLRYYQDAHAAFDWDGPDAEADWDPIFGSRFNREFCKWMKESDFDPRTCGGLEGVVAIMASNANTTPVTTWMLIHILSSPALVSAVREEVASALSPHPTTGLPTFNIQALTSLPLLQSIYTETLRLHVSVNIMREVIKPLDIAGYTLAPGSIIQAPTSVAHFDEEVWAVDGHPASEFYAERHIKVVDGKRAFECAGKGSNLFPFGGGVVMCPGRHFAKQEILLTVAMLLSKFEIEFVEWVRVDDGKPAGRAPRDDTRQAGAGGMHPDVDMKVRMTRVW
ncbi:cholesterol 7-alpha-monooxygenase 4 [Podospora aff. communis PSN243]|uniref:Cholesterol 7-alpha-monooxygenase 4 n=1 Tax=Podospora aff. communis PSN243 TaxID=3040156 RepID=A0AAV9G5U9_9PEZI|nr:cholesterol 7-alpha-monooxygenase 4 [Podospora aff. communis PSN243]